MCCVDLSRRAEEPEDQAITTAYQDEFETVVIYCQNILAELLAKYRESVYSLAMKNSGESTGEKGALRLLNTDQPRALNSSVRQSTTGIWEYDFFADTWIWVFDYSTGDPSAGTSSACLNSSTVLYSICWYVINLSFCFVFEKDRRPLANL